MGRAITHVAVNITLTLSPRQTDTRLTASFSKTIWVSWHQKGTTILDFNKGRDDGVAVASAGPYAKYLHLALDR